MNILVGLGIAFVGFALWKFIRAFWLPHSWRTRAAGLENNWRNEAWMAEEDGIERRTIYGFDPGGNENQYGGGDTGGHH